MSTPSISHCQHTQQFSSANTKGEQRTYWVLGLTLITMLVEIGAGTLFGSMALLADGWHMSTHAAAFILTIFAYRYARKHAANPAFSFGTGKVNVLGGYTSAIALGLVAFLMLAESLHRLFNPEVIQFNEAIAVAVIGLVVNIVSAFLLKDDHHHHHHNHEHDHHHSHDHDHHHPHHHEHHDHNLKAAYMHVLADALTSLLAIVALMFGKYFGLNWLDAMMGIVGAVIISRWAWGLIQQTSPILLDGNIDQHYQDEIIKILEADAVNQVKDIHIWKVSAHHYAAMITLNSLNPKAAADYKQMLAKFDKLHHLTIEVNQQGA